MFLKNMLNYMVCVDLFWHALSTKLSAGVSRAGSSIDTHTLFVLTGT